MFQGLQSVGVAPLHFADKSMHMHSFNEVFDLFDIVGGERVRCSVVRDGLECSSVHG